MVLLGGGFRSCMSRLCWARGFWGGIELGFLVGVVLAQRSVGWFSVFITSGIPLGVDLCSTSPLINMPLVLSISSC
jgi:hypothetical protein